MYMRQSIQSVAGSPSDVGKTARLELTSRCDNGWSLVMNCVEGVATQRSWEWKSLGYMG